MSGKLLQSQCIYSAVKGRKEGLYYSQQGTGVGIVRRKRKSAIRSRISVELSLAAWRGMMTQAELYQELHCVRSEGGSTLRVLSMMLMSFHYQLLRQPEIPAPPLSSTLGVGRRGVAHIRQRPSLFAERQGLPPESLHQLDHDLPLRVRHHSLLRALPLPGRRHQVSGLMYSMFLA